MAEIVNKVAQSALVTIDLEEYLTDIEVKFLDLKPFLFQEMILREKDFRAHMANYPWHELDGTYVVIGCSAEAIIPSWAYMLVSSKLAKVAKDFRFGDVEEQERFRIDIAVERLAAEDWNQKKVVVKGCGDLQARDYAYTEVTKALLKDVSSIMYGEPCSTVPIYKKPKAKRNL